MKEELKSISALLKNLENQFENLKTLEKEIAEKLNSPQNLNAIDAQHTFIEGTISNIKMCLESITP